MLYLRIIVWMVLTYICLPSAFSKSSQRLSHNKSSFTPIFQVDPLTDLLNPSQTQERCITHQTLLEKVDESWQYSPAFDSENKVACPSIDSVSFIQEKLNNIIIPKIHFNNMPLSRVVQALSEISVEYDSDTTKNTPKGINIIVIDLEKKDPTLTLMLREASLEKILQYVSQSVNYQYDLDEDTVILRPSEGKGSTYLKTKFFPLSRSTVIQLTSFNTPIKTSLDNNEKAQPSTETPILVEAELKAFLQRAGVDFKNIEGSSLAFDGIQLIVTQTPRNLERINNILKRYSSIKQVEIEAKFMEVQQGVLEELGFQWNLQYGNMHIQTSNPITHQTTVRNLANAFTHKGLTLGDGYVRVANPLTGAIGYENTIPNRPPTQPNAINVGMSANDIINILGVADRFKVEAIIRALEQHTGTDLMSAPKITVLSGKTAEIVVAQELRYPTSYGDIDSAVGSASLGTSSAGVTITAGTPHDFKVQRVGVQMEVTPSVEEDNKSISLRLEPKVTEFEGFVEYGGMSVAISGNTAVNVPSGFYQPIFSVRQIKTEVTIYDGATVVMGGLTREEVREVKDKVPLFGNLPIIGRLFRSQGETSQKKNLLIFVTANLVSPGGASIKRSYPCVTNTNSSFHKIEDSANPWLKN